MSDVFDSLQERMENALEQGRSSEIARLLTTNIDLPLNIKTGILNAAVKSQQLRCIQAALEAGVDVRHIKKDLARKAFQKDQKEIFSLLSQHGYDFSTVVRDPLDSLKIACLQVECAADTLAAEVSRMEEQAGADFSFDAAAAGTSNQKPGAPQKPGQKKSEDAPDAAPSFEARKKRFLLLFNRTVSPAQQLQEALFAAIDDGNTKHLKRALSTDMDYPKGILGKALNRALNKGFDTCAHILLDHQAPVTYIQKDTAHNVIARRQSGLIERLENAGLDFMTRTYESDSDQKYKATLRLMKAEAVFQEQEARHIQLSAYLTTKGIDVPPPPVLPTLPTSKKGQGGFKL